MFLKVLRLKDPSYLLKKLKLREETYSGAEAPSTSNDKKTDEDSHVSNCEFHFSLKFFLICGICNFLFYYIFIFHIITIFVERKLGRGLD